MTPSGMADAPAIPSGDGQHGGTSPIDVSSSTNENSSSSGSHPSLNLNSSGDQIFNHGSANTPASSNHQPHSNLTTTSSQQSLASVSISDSGDQFFANDPVFVISSGGATTVTAEQIATRIEDFETAAQELAWRLRAIENVFHLMARVSPPKDD